MGRAHTAEAGRCRRCWSVPCQPRAFALWNPPRARPRGAHLPGRVLRAARPRDLERQLVRRPLHALLQRAVPAAGGAARPDLGRGAGGGRVRMAVRPPGARPLGRAARARRGCGSPRSASLAMLANGWLAFALGVALRAREPARAAARPAGARRPLAALCARSRARSRRVLLALVAGDRSRSPGAPQRPR